ncbi:MAG: N-acetylmuramoyl-L-alanine amidase [Actinomycetia bacterium]|nr:N-acetylmuramoyl-L-alanine amidase [Actinomycetes bacterium]
MTTGGSPLASDQPRNRAERRAAARRNRGRKAVAALTGASLVTTGMGVLFASPASASTFTVNSGADDGGGSDTTLREALDAANSHPGSDRISFDPALTEVTISGGTLQVSDDVVIDGSDPARTVELHLTTDSATHNGGASLLAVTYSGLTIEDLTISGTAATEDGGAIRSYAADVVLDHVTLSGNTVTGAVGGAAYLVSSDVTIVSSAFTDNSAFYSSGGGTGGGLWVSSAGSVSISATDFTGNRSYYDGGGAYVQLSGSAELTVTGSHFTENGSDSQDGGGLSVRARGHADLDVAISGTTFTENDADGVGGGLALYAGNADARFSVTDTTFTRNEAHGPGGGLRLRANSSDATLTVSDSTFDTNTTADSGGGLHLDGPAGVTIERTTIAGNHAFDSGGGLSAAAGAVVTAVASTISDNTASTGAGAYVSVSAATFRQSTVTDNEASDVAGGIQVEGSSLFGNYPASLTLDGSIVAANRAPARPDLRLVQFWTFGPADETDLSQTSASAIHSLVGDVGNSGITGPSGSNLVGVDPLLAPLALNGGTTANHLPLAGSPAIGAGDPVYSGATTDQRGASRVSGGRIDIGSVEVQIAPVFISAPPAPAPTGGTTTLTPGPAGSSTASVPTSAGPVSVTVTPPAGGGAPTSAHVDVVGGTSLPADGLTVLPTAFEVTMTGGSVGTAKVCFPYSQADLVKAGLDENAIQLFHFLADGTREVITGSVDMAANVICGDTTSFSPFAIGVLDTTRVAGIDAPSTAAALSAATFPAGAPVVYLTTADGFADALGAGPAAGAAGGPTLLVHHSDVPAVTQAELARLKPARIVLVGGTSVIGADVQAALTPLAAKVERVAGADRAGTAAMLSAATFQPGVPVVYVVNGTGFADGLVAGAAAAATSGPVLLTGRDALPAATADELARLKPAKVVVVGGSAAVADSVVKALGASRLAGADRYETAAVVAETFQAGTSVLAATGESPADALAAVAAAAKTRSAVVLVRPTGVPARLLTALGVLKPKAIKVVGGTAAVSRNTEANLAKGLGS